MTTEKLQIIRQIEELLGKGLELHPAPNYSSAASPWARLMAVKKNQAKYLLDEQGRLVGLNLAGMELDDGLWGKIAALLEKEGVRLQALNLCSNQLKKFVPPLGIAGMIELDLEDNPLDDPPPEMMQQGREAVLRFLQSGAAEGRSEVWEVKMLIVGDEGTGKTTLWNLLQDENYPVPNDRNITQGIQISSLSLDASDYHGRHVGVQVHLWDFGGQEIQYMIHHFFLTRRSVYVLLSDGREDAASFFYWLNIIDHLGCDPNNKKKMPILVVLNERRPPGALDERLELPKNLKEVESKLGLKLVDRCADFAEKGPRLQEIFNKIKELVGRAPHLPLNMPKPWADVRAEIETRRDGGMNHATREEFSKICRDNGIDDPQAQGELGQFLHDLGVIFYFPESTQTSSDLRLADFVVLNPRWAVEAVYAVLKPEILGQGKNAGSEAQAGRFSLGDFTKIWQEKKFSPDEQAKLRDLMLKKKFGICFLAKEEDDKEVYIAPLLLPELPAKDMAEWKTCDALRHAYRYQFMPLGIMGRLIVLLHEDLETDKQERKMAWRNAACLHDGMGRSRSLVFLGSNEEKKSDSVQIVVKGGTVDDRRHLLQRIRMAMDKVNKHPFSRLEIAEKIPCCCEKCLNAEEPFEHDLTLLQNDAKEGLTMAQCQKSRLQVPVRKLIEGIPCEEMERVPHVHEKTLRDMRSEKEIQASEKRDVFICHASEDKKQVVRPLVDALAKEGFSCWVDESEIKWGDSITKKINEGLSMSRYVMVVLSSAFSSKEYPQRELHAALHQEASSGVVKLLPLLVGTAQEREEILNRFSLLNDKRCLEWKGNSSDVVSALRSRIAAKSN